MYSAAQLELLQEVAEMDPRWQPILRAAKEIEARVVQILEENAAEEQPVRVCPWLVRHRVPDDDAP
jgi:hypothetical protein